MGTKLGNSVGQPPNYPGAGPSNLNRVSSASSFVAETPSAPPLNPQAGQQELIPPHLQKWFATAAFPTDPLTEENLKRLPEYSAQFAESVGGSSDVPSGYPPEITPSRQGINMPAATHPPSLRSSSSSKPTRPTYPGRQPNSSSRPVIPATVSEEPGRAATQAGYQPHTVIQVAQSPYQPPGSSVALFLSNHAKLIGTLTGLCIAGAIGVGIYVWRSRAKASAEDAFSAARRGLNQADDQASQTDDQAFINLIFEKANDALGKYLGNSTVFNDDTEATKIHIP